MFGNQQKQKRPDPAEGALTLRNDDSPNNKVINKNTLSKKRKEKRMVKKMRKLLATPVHEGFLSCGGNSQAETEFMNNLTAKEGIKNG
jgi:hypothetical protein